MSIVVLIGTKEGDHVQWILLTPNLQSKTDFIINLWYTL